MNCNTCSPLFKWFALTVVLSLWIDPINGITIELIPQVPKVNQNVTMRVNGIIGVIRSFSWYKGSEPNTQNQILNYNPNFTPPQTAGAKYFSHAHGLANGSLLITNLNKTYEGDYTVQIQTNIQEQATVKLTVSGIDSFRASPACFMGALLISVLTLQY
ncbi:cell adhesion molecule CEACAM19-like isoform 1-T2 [Rhinophrynus dorsalis]